MLLVQHLTDKPLTALKPWILVLILMIRDADTDDDDTDTDDTSVTQRDTTDLSATTRSVECVCPCLKTQTVCVVPITRHGI
jgi:hypothetical protein